MSNKAQFNKNLKIDYNLPIISIPSNKTIPFLKWYCEDISNTRLSDIPKVFEEGYITISNIPCEFINNCKSEFIKKMAKECKTTYRVIEEELERDVYSVMLNDIVISYKFIDNLPNITIFSSITEQQIINIPLQKYRDVDYKLLSSLGDISGIGNTIIIKNASCAIDGEHEFQNSMMMIYTGLFISAMWYMTLYKNKYRYEQQLSKEEVKDTILNRKRPKKVSNTKIITTSFYDLSKAPQSKVQTMIKRREGFEYSHQFDVRGHYRHYKDGKIVFIESYVKAKDKPKLQRNIILNPEEKGGK